MKLCLSFFLILFYGGFTFSQSYADRLVTEPTTYKSASGKEVEAVYGKFTVPEYRENPESEVITMEFIQLKSTNPNPEPPLFYLEGGPGSSCTWQAGNANYLEGWMPFLEVGDVVLVDQRGTGNGARRTMWGWDEKIPENILADTAALKQIFAKANQKALAAMKERGVDLRGYTTKESATDFNELRQALGFDKISIYGFSYGTHLGLAYLRYFGSSVENAILVGTEGPNHNYKLPSAIDAQFYKINELAKADEAVNQDVPDLIALYHRVINKLAENPAEFVVGEYPDGDPIKIKIGPVGLNWILRVDIGDASDIPVFPRLLYTINQGDYSALEWFVRKRFSGFGVFGMSKTMDMASGATADRVHRIEKENQKSPFKNMTNADYSEIGWPRYDLGDDYRSPLHSNVRTLFMSGTLDFNTPPHQAEEVRWGFPNSSHIIVKNAGHEQVVRHPKSTETMVKFLQGKSVDDVALFLPRVKFIPVKGKEGTVWHPALGKR